MLKDRMVRINRTFAQTKNYLPPPPKNIDVRLEGYKRSTSDVLAKHQTLPWRKTC